MCSEAPEPSNLGLGNGLQSNTASSVPVGVSLFCPGEAPRHGQLMVTSQTTVGDVRKYLRDVLGVPMDRQKWVSLQRMGRGVLGAEGGGGGDSGGGGGLASAFGGMGCEAVMLLDASRTLDSYGALTSDTEIHAAAAPPRSADGARGPRMQPGVPWGNAAPACPVMVLLPSGKLAALQRLSVDSKYEMLDDVMCDSSSLDHNSMAFDGSELTTAGVPLRATAAPNLAMHHLASGSTSGGGGAGGGYVQTLGGGIMGRGRAAGSGGGAAGAVSNGGGGGGSGGVGGAAAGAAGAAGAATAPTGEPVPGAQGDSTGAGPGSGAVATPTTYGRDGRPVEVTVAASYCY
ncbi:hypothetical protein CHLRE_17g716650v5 [Chlamydomonas reinhardtii]|uniref:Ubiquitin-like domain-containing protein n=1 Tax=Chlamydomonas reinhardtii TaxID=3055 RepID=A0A2K3CQ23_CHLRE|nr:uncharacterized protein CHLRE_17g716650v5 [Chlamydomonas reinhardtii]PNW70363.1 hypothetical protein CHLRE_17g716650v5 [Chlamydomonas reinhardtii]